MLYNYIMTLNLNIFKIILLFVLYNISQAPSLIGPDHADRFGVNFAVACSGASGQTRLPLLGLQIDAFNSLVMRGIIHEEDLEDSSGPHRHLWQPRLC
jgi:hypothetical protein